MKKFLEKIQEMRFLPVFVVLSMVIGIAIGKWYGISNFELTPPIDAIKSIFQGTYQFSLANSLALGVVIGLFLMIYPAMTNVKVEDMGKAARSPKQLLIVLFFNYLVAPFFMLLLAKVFLAGDHDLYVGLVLYGLAPCIAMVIVFTFLSLGNNALAIILVAINKKTGATSVVSFPRDLYVTLPGYRQERINVAQPLGGFELTQATFQYNFGFTPDYYLLTNFQGFVNIIDSLGGINVYVPWELYDDCSLPIQDSTGKCSVGPGQVYMDGETALWYARSRYSTSSPSSGRV